MLRFLHKNSRSCKQKKSVKGRLSSDNFKYFSRENIKNLRWMVNLASKVYLRHHSSLNNQFLADC